jgi:hypothetical protein
LPRAPSSPAASASSRSSLFPITSFTTARLAQFHNEVRVARTISHRSVCLVALCVTFFVFQTLVLLPITADLSLPYAPVSTTLILGTAALAAYGFYASRGDEPLFGRVLLD